MKYPVAPAEAGAAIHWRTRPIAAPLSAGATRKERCHLLENPLGG